MINRSSLDSEMSVRDWVAFTEHRTPLADAFPLNPSDGIFSDCFLLSKATLRRSTTGEAVIVASLLRRFPHAIHVTADSNQQATADSGDSVLSGPGEHRRGLLTFGTGFIRLWCTIISWRSVCGP